MGSYIYYHYYTYQITDYDKYISLQHPVINLLTSIEWTSVHYFILPVASFNSFPLQPAGVFAQLAWTT